MDIKLMLPELNENQRKWLRTELMKIVKEARETTLPLAYIERKIEELFTDIHL